MTTAEDTANFSSPELPFLQSLGNASRHAPVANGARGDISTGLPRLDNALALPAEPRLATQRFGLSQHWLPESVGNYESSQSGVRRGEVTEIVGHRGSGKSVLAMSIAAEVLQAKEGVLWIDTAGPLYIPRLKSLLRSKEEGKRIDGTVLTPDDEMNELQKFQHFRAQSLSHLFALICRPPRGFPPEQTSLIVIDSISCLFTAEFQPRLPKRFRKTALPPKEQKILDKESRLYFNLIGRLLSDLRRLALRLDCAVIVINEMASRFRSRGGPVLHKVISGYTWAGGVATTVLVYWHWLPPGMRTPTGMRKVRIAEVQRAGGSEFLERLPSRIVPFLVETDGLREFLDEESIEITTPGTPRFPKSKSEKRGLEGATPDTPNHRIKLELDFEDTRPEDNDDDEILDPLPGENEDFYEVPDSENELDGDEVSLGSRTPSNRIASETELLLEHLEDDALY